MPISDRKFERLKGFLICCDCKGKDHDEHNKLCPVELFLDIILQHQVQWCLHDIIAVEPIAYFDPDNPPGSSLEGLE